VAAFLISLVFILPMLAFYLWMFRDMAKNEYIPRESKSNWLLAFIFFNVFAAAVYYVNEYRNRH
jgi:hypothetical protein